ncbi:transposase family protein [Streptomyces sp. E2N166]|uniref:transposase family protein n=1 Tax=Streptomyces sp. E2N166 TaxID=1851909 RepID=UPI001EE8D2E1|nr:transposase family protein [Streptomyces sp. E2N166]
MITNGTLIRTRRRTGKDNRKNHPGKSRCHGLLVIALTDDRGRLLWVSATRPGRTSEITACRHDRLTARLRPASAPSPTWASSASSTRRFFGVLWVALRS